MSFDPAKIEIRPLERPDIDTIVAIAELLEEAPHWPREQYESMFNPDSARPRIVLIASDTQTKEVIGVAVASLVRPEAELETIAVAAHTQRRGVGRRLLDALIADLRKAGAAELLLEVRFSNLAAIHFYVAQGFAQTGVRPRYYADPEEDAVLMRLPLD